MCIAVHYRMMSIGFRLDINIKAGDWLIPSTDAGRKFIGEGPNNKKKGKKRTVDIFGGGSSCFYGVSTPIIHV